MCASYKSSGVRRSQGQVPGATYSRNYDANLDGELPKIFGVRKGGTAERTSPIEDN